MQEYGVQPDILVCRTEKPLNDSIKNKIALFCNVSPAAVIESSDTDSIYRVPLLMREEKLDLQVLKKTKMSANCLPELQKWEEFIERLQNPEKTVKIALVGKYVELMDAYKSIIESLIHAGTSNRCKVDLKMIHSEHIEKGNIENLLEGVSGILVAPGFGERGIEGKITAISYARTRRIPFLGICLGMQCATIEFARNVLSLSKAHSTEMLPDTPHPVIDIMEEQKKITLKGGTMRLGAYACNLKKGTKAYKIYGEEKISERHRHRYEFNNKYLDIFEKNGMISSGKNPDTNLVEIMEIPDHPWFVGVQFHPEYRSTVASPHPLFVNFVKAANEYENTNRF
jgi:CTP synthase